MRRTAFLSGVAVALLSGGVARAADEPSVPTAAFRSSSVSTVQKVSLSVSDIPLADALKKLADQAKVTILVEPGLANRVTVNLTGQTVERALSNLTGDAGPLWAKVEAVQKKDASLPSEPLFDLVRALQTLSARRMTFQLGDVKETVTLNRESYSTADLRSTVEASRAVGAGEKTTTLYVVAARTKPAAGASAEGTPADQAIAMQQRRFEVMQGMSPEERKRVLQQEYLFMLSLPVEARMQMALFQSEAFKSLPPELREQFMRSKMETGERLNPGGEPKKGAPSDKGVIVKP